MAIIIGTSGDDVLTGTPGDDIIDGGDGDDVIDGRGGRDLLRGGAGNDRFIFSGGPSTYDGGTGYDTFDVSSYKSYLFFVNQPLDFRLGTDGKIEVWISVYQRGGPWTDVKVAEIVNVERFLLGEGTRVSLDSYTTGLTVIGGASFDHITTGAGDDWIDGGAGDETIRPGGGSNTVIGGDGEDLVHLDYAFSASTLTFQTGGVRVVSGAAVNTLLGVERIVFTDRIVDLTPEGGIVPEGNRIEGHIGNQTLTGTEQADIMFGHGGDDRMTGGGGDDWLFGGSGNDTLISSFGHDRLYGGFGDDTFVIQRLSFGSDPASFSTINGEEGFDTVDLSGIARLPFSRILATGGADGRLVFSVRSGVEGGSDTAFASVTNVERYLGGASGEDFRFRDYTAAVVVDAGAGDDTIVGSRFGDILRGGAGSDVLDGGGGVDTAVYAGGRRQYSASSTSVSGGPEGGTDTLVSIEALRFVDGSLTFDVDSQAAQIMRLYAAALDRQPDQSGFEAQLDNLERGVSLATLANAFVTSPEFQARYGALNNQQFVEQLYRFCLNREGDPQGIQGWVTNLNNGLSRQDALVFFSESQEHRDLTAPTLNRGLWVADDNATVIARLYDATFDRLPDPGGLAGWTANLASGMPLLTIAAAFASSQEFQDRYGALNNQQFVEQMYRFCLNREGDPEGVAGWVANMNAGLSRAEVLMFFSESAEHVALTRPFWLGGIQFDGFRGAPAIDAAPKSVDDEAQALMELDGSSDAKTFDGPDDQPQIVTGLDTGDAETSAADPSDASVFDKAWADDAFVLPPLDEFTPLVLPEEIEGLDAFDLADVRPFDNRQGEFTPTLDPFGDGMLDNPDPWVRPHDHGDHWLQ